MLKIVAKKKRDKPKEKNKDKDKKGGKGKTKNAFVSDPYEEDFPWRVPPMSKAEILQAIRDGPSLYELQRKTKSVNEGSALDPTKHVQLNGAYIDSSELDQISPKTHNEKFFEPVQFETFEDFVKSSYHEKFAAVNKRETPLSKSDFDDDIKSIY